MKVWVTHNDHVKWRTPITEEQTVNEFLSMAMIGSAETIEHKIQALLHNTQADELIFTCDLYEHKDRLHSFDILAGLLG